MQGRDRLGQFLDPCTDPFGQVFGIDCGTIDLKYWYSGDPVIHNGWLNTHPDNQIQLHTNGPFRLEAGNEVELFIAYVVGRGTDAINSITIARNIGIIARATYYQNFNIISSVEDKSPIVSEFSLGQNYPNPFNPITTIKYQIPELSFVTLIVCDVLGNEIATLVNEEKLTGDYDARFDARFDATEMSSGIYFYKLQAGSIITTKKMILLK